MEREGLRWKKELIQSKEFKAAMAPYKEQVFNEVADRLELSPPTTVYGSSQPPRIGYRPDERDEVDLFPKIQPNRD
jgi:hypothetical protein